MGRRFYKYRRFKKYYRSEPTHQVWVKPTPTTMIKPIQWVIGVIIVLVLIKLLQGDSISFISEMIEHQKVGIGNSTAPYTTLIKTSTDWSKPTNEMVEDLCRHKGGNEYVRYINGGCPSENCTNCFSCLYKDEYSCINYLNEDLTEEQMREIWLIPESWKKGFIQKNVKKTTLEEEYNIELNRLLKANERCPLFNFLFIQAWVDERGNVNNPKTIELPAEYAGWRVYSDPLSFGRLACRKGKYQGEKLNYWYCGKDQADRGLVYVSKTSITPDGTIGKTIRKTIYIIYDQDENYVKTICGDDPDTVATRNLKNSIKQIDDFFNSVSP